MTALKAVNYRHKLLVRERSADRHLLAFAVDNRVGGAVAAVLGGLARVFVDAAGVLVGGDAGVELGLIRAQADGGLYKVVGAYLALVGKDSVGKLPKAVIAELLGNALGGHGRGARVGMDALQRKLAVHPGDLTIAFVYYFFERRVHPRAERTLEVGVLDKHHGRAQRTDNMVGGGRRAHIGGGCRRLRARLERLRRARRQRARIDR